MLRIIVAASVAAVLGLAAPAVATDKPDLTLYGALPKIEEVVISPDGTKLAVVTTDGDRRYLTVRKTEGGGIAGVALKATKLRDVMWAGEDHVVLVVSQASQGMTLEGPPREYFMASDFNIATNKLRPLLDGAKKVGTKIGVEETFNIIVGPPQVRVIKGDPVVFLEGVRYLRGTAADTLYAINLRTGALRLAENTPRYSTDGWLVDIDGKPVAQSTYDIKSGRGALLIKAGGGWKKVDEADSPTGSYGISGLGRDGKSVLVWRRGDDDVLREYSSGGGREALPGDLNFDGLIHDPYSARLLGGYTLDGDALRYTFFNPAVQSAWYAAIKPFKDARVSLKSWSRDWSRVIVQVDKPAEGPSYYLIDLKTGKGWFQSRVYEAVKPEAISPVRSIKYKAADGLEISGYLTLPRERQPTNLPLIVLAQWRPRRPRRPGLRLVEPGPGLARLRRAAGQLPGLGRLWPGLREGRLWRMGQEDADRPVGRRPRSGPTRNHRSQARLHHGRLLRRLRGPGGRHSGQGRLSLRRLRQRAVRPQRRAQGRHRAQGGLLLDRIGDSLSQVGRRPRQSGPDAVDEPRGSWRPILDLAALLAALHGIGQESRPRRHFAGQAG